MKVCIVGDGLVSLTIAKALVNQGIYVDVFSNQKINKIDRSRTIGISKANIDFFNENILNIKELLWDINKIEIYSENLKNEKILNFQHNNKKLFSIIKNFELYEHLILALKKNTLFKQKKNSKKILTKNYRLILNCDIDSFFTKKFFSKKLNKNYHSYAHITIIEHEKILNNDTATQTFTKKGPLAFLPISDTKTSVVYSARGLKKIDLEYLLKKYNFKYSIIKINQISSVKLKSVNLRNYYFENILAFGDLLHKLHPLAGQGFNMSIRDIKLLMDLIKFKLNHGLELDKSICVDFENKIKHKNHIFSSSIDFIYEFFNLESRTNNSILSNSVKALGNNRYVNKFFTKIADSGMEI